MSSFDFDPAIVTCPDWKKIDPKYKFSSSNAQKCVVCGKHSNTRCAGCLVVSYCGQDHQKRHWKKEHKNSCCPFKILSSPSAGRYVVATRDIRPGEVIIKEQPIVVGPKQYTQPICLGCYCEVDGSYQCSSCRWPMCSEACEKRRLHRTLECPIFKESKYRPKVTPGCPMASPIYECVTPLRCYLMQFISQNNWNVMTAMEQHTVERQTDTFYEVNQTNTVKFLQTHMDIPRARNNESEDDSVSDEEVAKALTAMTDVLDVNAFEIRGPLFSVRGVFPLTAMMNSVCSPNTQNCIGEDFTCRVRAARAIKKGEEVTTSYTLTLAGTLYRRKHLKESKYFDCNCKRCADPTELGSHFSSILCPERDSCCPEGLIISSDPLDAEAPWKCRECNHSLSAEEVSQLTEKHEKAIEELPLEVDRLEDYLQVLENVFHPRHNLCLDLKFTLVQCLGRERKADPQMLKEAKRKELLCRQVLDNMTAVIPGGLQLSQLAELFQEGRPTPLGALLPSNGS